MINIAVGACTGTHRAFVCGETGQPLLHLDTPTSASWVTPASISLFSGQDTSLTAQGDAHLTAAHTVSAVSGQTTSLYTHSGGIKAITANAGLSLRAHTDAQQIWSDKDLTVQSTTDEIRIQASSTTLTAGQSQIEIKGGNITFTCPGTWTVKGASHAWAGAGSQAAELAALPVGVATKAPNFMELNFHDEWLMPVAGAPYVVVFDDGTTRKGSLDANGHARLEGVPNMPSRVYYGESPSKPEPRVAMPANTFKGGSRTNEEAIANIERHEQEAAQFWAEQANTEQRERFAELNTDQHEPEGEDAWHFLSAEQQKALSEQLQGDKT